MEINEKTNGEEEIYLAPETEVFEEAAEIARETAADEKFSFVLQYDANQKEFLLSVLQAVGAIVVAEDDDGHTLDTRMNMTQLAFVKRLDCVERVRTDEGINPFLAEEAIKLDPVQKNGDEAAEENAKTAQTAQIMSLTVDESTEVSAETDVAVASVTSSCCSCPTNTSMETAAVISDESYTSGYICCPGIEQWFKFVATRTGQYTICTTGNLDTIGALYDCCGDLITEVDDYAPCGKINFRIIRNLTAGNTYYVKVGISKGDVGSYTLRVTERVFANYVSINKDTIVLEKGVTYELPITPNYTYKGYNGAQRIPGLSVSIDPSNANEQKIWWWEQYGDVLDCVYDWDDDGDRYIHVTATGNGTAKLYAEDWNENGKRDECTVTVVTSYCGGDNYRDVTQHSMVWQSDGYYVCRNCGYRVKSPALQDKEILSRDDYLRVISLMSVQSHAMTFARERPLKINYYNEISRNCQIIINTIRSQPQYSELYEYKGANNKYYAIETDESKLALVNNSTVNDVLLAHYSGFTETLLSVVTGYCCPEIALMMDVVSAIQDAATGELTPLSLSAVLASLCGEENLSMALSFASFTSDVLTCEVKHGDPIVSIYFSAYSNASFVYDNDGNIKKAEIYL